MSQHTQLQASDGHKFDAYIAQPSGEPKAGVVVLQEIFGVNCAHPFRCGSLCPRRISGDRAGTVSTAPSATSNWPTGRRNPSRACRSYSAFRSIKPSRTLPPPSSIFASTARTRLELSATAGVARSPGSATRASIPTRPSPTIPAEFNITSTNDSALRRFFTLGSTTITSRNPWLKKYGMNIPAFPSLPIQVPVTVSICDMRPSYNEAAAKLAQQRTLAHFDEFLVSHALICGATLNLSSVPRRYRKSGLRGSAEVPLPSLV